MSDRHLRRSLNDQESLCGLPWLELEHVGAEWVTDANDLCRNCSAVLLDCLAPVPQSAPSLVRLFVTKDDARFLNTYQQLRHKARAHAIKPHALLDLLTGQIDSIEVLPIDTRK